MPWKPFRPGVLVTLACLLVIGGLPSAGDAHGGDSLYGKVVEVQSAEVVTLDCSFNKYQLRIAGIDAPKDEGLAKEATELVAKLVYGKTARTRFDHLTPDGLMLSRLFTDDSVQGIREVGVELVKAGLASRQADYEDPSGLLADAELQAQKAGLGLWSDSKTK